MKRVSEAPLHPESVVTSRTGGESARARMTAVQAAIFFAFLVGLLFLYAARDVLVVLFVAFIIASALRAPMAWLEQWLSRVLALLVLYLGMLAVLVTIAAIVIPVLVSEGQDLIEMAPEYWDSLMGALNALEEWAGQQRAIPEDELVPAPMLSEEVARRLFTVPLGIFSGLLGVVGILALSFYWLLARETLLGQIACLVPGRYRERFTDIFDRVEHKLGAYVRGQLLVSLIVGSLTFIGLTLLGVRHAPLLAVLAALLEVVPMIGPVVAAIPAILLATTQSLLLGLAVLAFYVVLQQVESYVISPKVQQMAIRLNPFWILLAVLLGGSIMGILGALIGVPVAVVASVLLTELVGADKSDGQHADDVGSDNQDATPAGQHREGESA